MQAEELRIGNYLLHDGYFIKSYSVDGFINIIKNIDKYEPIPLTEEWLARFGFTRYYEKSNSFVNRTHSNFMVLEYYEDTCFFTGDEGVNMSTDLKYVHQLQNLYFALTQKELIIK
jgi:hypothetical protein